MDLQTAIRKGLIKDEDEMEGGFQRWEIQMWGEIMER
jgi:hypothetical protein